MFDMEAAKSKEEREEYTRMAKFARGVLGKLGVFLL